MFTRNPIKNSRNVDVAADANYISPSLSSYFRERERLATDKINKRVLGPRNPLDLPIFLYFIHTTIDIGPSIILDFF
jgi:hypothetical protein